MHIHGMRGSFTTKAAPSSIQFKLASHIVASKPKRGTAGENHAARSCSELGARDKCRRFSSRGEYEPTPICKMSTLQQRPTTAPSTRSWSLVGWIATVVLHAILLPAHALNLHLFDRMPQSRKRWCLEETPSVTHLQVSSTSWVLGMLFTASQA